MLKQKVLLFLLWPCFAIEASSLNFLDLSPQLHERDEIPFIMCNEENQNEVIQQLSQAPLLANGVHIGWSIEFNFKIILIRKPSLVILCDINKRVLEFYEAFEKILLSSNSRRDCLENLHILFDLQETYFFNEHSKTWGAALQSFSEWLSEESFYMLKQMYVEKRVFHIILNTLDREDRFLKLANWIRENGYAIDTIYASNISNWVQKQEPFFSNFLKLIGRHTFFIDAEYQKQKQKMLSLRITQGLLPWITPAVISRGVCDAPRKFQDTDLSN